MKSIFILGASILQVPAIKKAKEKGLYVYVLDYDSSAVGIQYADEFLEISTIDKEAVYKAALIKKPNYIITSTSDMPIRTVSWVCEKLGMKSDISYQNAVCATDKWEMRKRMKDYGVPIPRFHLIDSYESFVEYSIEYPRKFVLKPVDNSASRGVVLVDKNQKKDLHTIYDYSVGYSRNGNLLIEEYMEGPEVSVEAFTVEGVTHIITITDKIITEEPFFVEIGHTEPSRLPEDVQNEIRIVVKSAVSAIGILNGPSHTEVKVTEDGVKLVEIAARLGGDFITSKLVPLSTGVDMVECSFNCLLDKNIDYQVKESKGAAIRFIQSSDGVIKSIEGINEALECTGVKEVEIYKNVGDRVNSLKNSGDRIGHILSVGETPDIAACVAEKALKNIKIEYDANI